MCEPVWFLRCWLEDYVSDSVRKLDQKGKKNKDMNKPFYWDHNTHLVKHTVKEQFFQYQEGPETSSK